MIKLEDLKVGDMVYGVTSDGLGIYQKSIVKMELFILDTSPEPCEAVICDGGIDIITRAHQPYIFRTEIEAKLKQDELQLIKAQELLNSNEFLDRLFECATSSKRLRSYSETPIYKLAIELWKKNNK